jgi:thioredoxin 1
MVKAVTDYSEFQNEIKKPGLVVVDYFATWCGPCKIISPIFEQLKDKYPNVTFLKVDVDEADEIAQERQIQSMPTFQFFVAGNMVEEFHGADSKRLEEIIIQYDKPPKDPSEMTIKELKAAIVNLRLGPKALGFSEKQEFVNLLKEYYLTSA